jgi:class 3 adenylate cyclase
MTRGPLAWLYRRLGRRYLLAAIALQFQLSYLVVLGGVALLGLFASLDRTDFWRILAVAEALTLVEVLLALGLVRRLLAPARPWLDGRRTPRTAVAAWSAIAGLPLDFLRYRRALAAAVNVVPISLYVVWELDQPFLPAFPILLAATSVVLTYGILLRFFGMETITRPVLEDVSREVPGDADLPRRALSVRWRLLLAVPAINVISGVVVSGVSADDRSLGALGIGVAVAIAVAFTISLALSSLLASSIVRPLRDLRRGTEAVAAGNLDVRVPVLGADEMGRLAAGFNAMVTGLAERERLREAFGAYVDPEVAERVLAGGTPELEGEEVVVTVVFLDIRDFTAFTEQASAREVVALLNAFYADVVPVLLRHGGHANKFVGDGLLAVFGAPDHLPDHADRAVAAALEIAALVRAAYGDRLRIGAGVSSGPVVAGTVGGGGRMEFTVIGDAVNTAARVEEVTRLTGDDVLITDRTRRLLTRAHGGFVRRPTVALKGKTERVELFAPRAAAAGRGPGRPGSEVTSVRVP